MLDITTAFDFETYDCHGGDCDIVITDSDTSYLVQLNNGAFKPECKIEYANGEQIDDGNLYDELLNHASREYDRIVSVDRLDNTPLLIRDCAGRMFEVIDDTYRVIAFDKDCDTAIMKANELTTA